VNAPPVSKHTRQVFAALAVCVAIGLLINFLLLQHRAPGALEGPSVAERISQGIQFNDHLAAPPAIRCPATEPLRQGVTFRCSGYLGGRHVPITVMVASASGELTFQVAAPGGRR
jgi:hypothetical protein